MPLVELIQTLGPVLCLSGKNRVRPWGADGTQSTPVASRSSVSDVDPGIGTRRRYPPQSRSTSGFSGDRS